MGEFWEVILNLFRGLQGGLPPIRFLVRSCGDLALPTPRWEGAAHRPSRPLAGISPPTGGQKPAPSWRAKIGHPAGGQKQPPIWVVVFVRQLGGCFYPSVGWLFLPASWVAVFARQLGGWFYPPAWRPMPHVVCLEDTLPKKDPDGPCKTCYSHRPPHPLLG